MRNLMLNEIPFYHFLFLCYARLPFPQKCYARFLFHVIPDSVIPDSVMTDSHFWLYLIQESSFVVITDSVMTDSVMLNSQFLSYTWFYCATLHYAQVCYDRFLRAAAYSSCIFFLLLPFLLLPIAPAAYFDHCLPLLLPIVPATYCQLCPLPINSAA